MDVQSKIDALERELSRINYDLDVYRRPLADAKAAYKSVQSKYHEYKALATQEFEAAQTCWNYGDKADAKGHSNRGHELKEKQHFYGSDLDRLKSEYESYLNAYNNKKAEKTGIIEQLKALREEAKHESAERRKAREAEATHWHEKSCQGCGTTIRYRDDWSHVPNFCKDCKSKFDAEKRAREKLRREKSCRGCGATIVYYEDWDHIPNYCKACREKGNTWSTQTKESKQNYGILDYSHGIRKQNSKDLSEGLYGTHDWYDPHTGQMGEAGPNYPGRRRRRRYEE